MSTVHDFPTGAKQYRLKLITAATLASTTFKGISFIVPRYIAPGLTVLAGRPKVGKSWMAANFAIAISTGGRALGTVDVEEGDVLYLALEDNQRRLQRRLDQIMPFDPKPQRLHFAPSVNVLTEAALRRSRRGVTARLKRDASSLTCSVG